MIMASVSTVKALAHKAPNDLSLHILFIQIYEIKIMPYNAPLSYTQIGFQSRQLSFTATMQDWVLTSSSIQLVLFYCVFRNLLRFHISQFGDEKLFLLRTVLLTEKYLMFTWDKITFSFSFLFVLSASEICWRSILLCILFFHCI